MDRLNYIERLKDQLHATDYIAIKYAEGIDCEAYGEWRSERQYIRDTINKLENLTDKDFNKEVENGNYADN